MKPFVISAPAKINLFLGVHTGRDSRGYHRVDSIMTAIDLADQLIFEEASELGIYMAPDLALPLKENTVWQAASLAAREFGKSAACHITINKRIPHQAGLGGSSSDAAAALCGLARLWKIDLLDPRMVAVAQQVGADVAFFLRAQACYMNRYGDCLVEEFRNLPECPLVLIKPPKGIQTNDAYSCFDENPTDAKNPARILSALRNGDLEQAAKYMTNNLEEAACALVPEISLIKKMLKDQEGLLKAQVSGSGSCVFALCKNETVAQKIFSRAQNKQWWSYVGKIIAAKDDKVC